MPHSVRKWCSWKLLVCQCDKFYEVIHQSVIPKPLLGRGVAAPSMLKNVKRGLKYACIVSLYNSNLLRNVLLLRKSIVFERIFLLGYFLLQYCLLEYFFVLEINCLRTIFVL